jgi:hypothetical protein
VDEEQVFTGESQDAIEADVQPEVGAEDEGAEELFQVVVNPQNVDPEPLRAAMNAFFAAFVPVDEAAGAIGISMAYMRNRIMSGKISCFKVAGRLMLPASLVEEIAAAGGYKAWRLVQLGIADDNGAEPVDALPQASQKGKKTKKAKAKHGTPAPEPELIDANAEPVAEGEAVAEGAEAPAPVPTKLRKPTKKASELVE